MHSNPEDLAVGQSVVVQSTYTPTARQEPGEITKVGRKLVTIKHGPYESQFRLEGQHINDGYGSLKFLTLTQLDERKRRAPLEEAIKNATHSVSWVGAVSEDCLRAVYDALKAEGRIR